MYVNFTTFFNTILTLIQKFLILFLMQQNIHNDFFLSLIKNKQNATDFLKEVLPIEIQQNIDFNYLDYDDTSYIQNRFKDLFSDLVIKTKIKEKNTDIYILVEHKSTPPEQNALFLQIFSYIYSMLERDFLDKKDFRIILPIVFYHGKNKWSIPSHFLDLFPDNSIKKYLLNFSYILFDTKNFDIEKSHIMHKNLILASGLIALKSAFNKKDIQSVIKIIENLNKEGLLTNIQKIEIFLVYILKTKDINEQEIIEIITNYNEEGGKIMLTLENYFIEKGIKQGIEEGIEKGKIETAKAMKKEGLDIHLIAKVTGLSITEIKKL